MMDSPPPPSPSYARASSTQQRTMAPSPNTGRRALSSKLLLVVTLSSVVSTLAFLAYLLLPSVTHTTRSRLTIVYAIGLSSLGVSELCLLVAILLLIGRWFAGASSEKEPKELLILIGSLIPGVPALLLLITLVVYLRARAKDPASSRTREAKRNLKERSVDLLVDQSSQQSQSAAQTARRRTTLRDATRRVVGPTTERALSDSAHGLVSLTLVALVVSTVATVSVVVPAKGLAPLRAGPSAGPAILGAGQTRRSTLPTGTIHVFPSSGAFDATLMTRGPDNALWFTDEAGDQIGRITPSGAVTLFPIPTVASAPDGIVAGPDGNLWFAEYFGDRIGRITPSGSIQEFLLPTQPIGQPRLITAGSDGNLWFTDDEDVAIGRCTPSGLMQEFSLPDAGQFGGITLGPDRNVWFTENGPALSKVGFITPGGTIQEFNLPDAASPAASITSGPDGNLWFTTGSNVIGRVTLSGSVKVFPITATDSAPQNIVAGPDGNLWFTDAGANQIGRMTPSGHLTEFPLPTLDSSPLGITVGADGNLWFTDIYGIGLIAP